MGKLIILSMALAVLCLLLLPVRAAEYDPDRPGSVMVTLEGGGKALEGAELTLYRVGNVTQGGYNQSFAPTADFVGADLTDLNREGLAEELAALARGGQKKSTDNLGRAVFSNLTPGLYLVVQTGKVKGYQPVAPFLAAMPLSEGNGWTYDIEARPKVAPEPRPTTPGGGGGGKPPLIQTGQLNWPVPVLAVSGILLFSLGWAMVNLRDKRR